MLWIALSLVIIFLIDHNLRFVCSKSFFFSKLQKQLWSSSDLCTGKTLVPSALDIRKALCGSHKVSGKQITPYRLIWVSMENFSPLTLPDLLTKSHSPAFLMLGHLKTKLWNNSHCNSFRFPVWISTFKHPFNHLHSQQRVLNVYMISMNVEHTAMNTAIVASNSSRVHS